MKSVARTAGVVRRYAALVSLVICAWAAQQEVPICPSATAEQTLNDCYKKLKATAPLSDIRELLGHQAASCISTPIPHLASGNTLLHVAVMLHSEPYSVDAVAMLLSLGADATHVNDRGQTPAYLAAAHGRLEVLRAVVRHSRNIGGDPCQPSLAGWTPLHAAAHKGHSEALHYLIDDVGCNVSALTNKNFTPLHLAVQGGRYEAVTLLMTALQDEAAQAAALAATTACLHTPGAIASLRHDEDMIALLRTWGSRDLNDAVVTSSALGDDATGPTSDL